jgi:acyl-CoA thioesterase-2
MINLSGHSSNYDLVRDFADQFDLEPVETDLFRSSAMPGAQGRCFGGQLVAQAFNAAQRTIDGKVAHNLHAHFLRPGSEADALILRVEREFDGRSFATRRVVAMQNNEPLLILTASFHRLEPGLAYAAAMPSVPDPETLLPLDGLARQYGNDITDVARAYLERRSAFEMRPVGYPSFLQQGKDVPVSHTWFRLRAPIAADDGLQRVMLAYVSDYALLSSALIPHGINMFETSMQTASLDHAMWFHDEAPLDDWLLYATDSNWAGRGRGRATGAIYTRDGRLIASTAQEGLIRLRPDRPAGGTIPHTP